MPYGGPSLSDLELRYPFAPKSRKFFESIPVEEGLASREVVGQAESRLLSALGRTKYEPHISELIEFSSFFAAALVASQDPFLTSKFSKKEAERAKEFFIKEAPEEKVVDHVRSASGCRYGRQTVTRVSLDTPCPSRATCRWSPVRADEVPEVEADQAGAGRRDGSMSDNMLNDLFGDCAQMAISDGVRNLRRASFPKQLLREPRAESCSMCPSREPKTGQELPLRRRPAEAPGLRWKAQAGLAGARSVPREREEGRGRRGDREDQGIRRGGRRDKRP